MISGWTSRVVLTLERNRPGDVCWDWMICQRSFSAGEKVLNSDGRPLSRINELEMVNGYVLANVWFDDNVYKIDPVSGDVVDTFNFQELYPKVCR